MITKSFRMTAVAALLCGVSAMAVAAVTAGTYEGAAQGKLSTVKAAVTLNQDGRITDVKLDVSGETPELGGAAAKKMAPAIVEHQSTAVDGMSGATVSSEAIRKAVAAAIEKAGADPKKYDVKVAKTVGADETLTSWWSARALRALPPPSPPLKQAPRSSCLKRDLQWAVPASSPPGSLPLNPPCRKPSTRTIRNCFLSSRRTSSTSSSWITTTT